MILDDVAKYLSTTVTALTLGTNLTKGFMPDSPDTVVTVFETGGYRPTHFLTTGVQTRAYENPGIMVHARSTDQVTARNLAESVFTKLDGLNNRGLPTTTGKHYVSIDAVQSPFSIGRDKNDRFVFSVNFDVTKTTG